MLCSRWETSLWKWHDKDVNSYDICAVGDTLSYGHMFKHRYCNVCLSTCICTSWTTLFRETILHFAVIEMLEVEMRSYYRAVFLHVRFWFQHCHLVYHFNEMNDCTRDIAIFEWVILPFLLQKKARLHESYRGLCMNSFLFFTCVTFFCCAIFAFGWAQSFMALNAYRYILLQCSNVRHTVCQVCERLVKLEAFVAHCWLLLPCFL